MGLIRELSKYTLLYVIITLTPGLPPQTTFPFKGYFVEPPKDLKGALEKNYHLEGAEHFLEDRILGPEALVLHNNEIYAGIQGGEVIKLSGDHVTFVTKVGKPCKAVYEESECGRPLGMAIDTQGSNLVLADSYYGIWLVNLDTLTKKQLVSPKTQLPGEIVRNARIFNGVAVDKDGNIFWTDSASDFALEDILYTFFTNPSGRLFKFDRIKEKNTVLLDQLAFPNGLALSPDEDFIVVAESTALRLTKYYLKGKLAGQAEVFVDGLPGMPDNLTPDADGIWVPLVYSNDNENPGIQQVLSNFPNVRKFIARMVGLFELPFQLLNSYYPCDFFKRAIHYVGGPNGLLWLRPERVTVVRVDWNGKIVGSLHGFDGSVGSVSHVLEFQDHLYLGSPYNRYLARVKSPKSSKQPNIKIRNVRVEGADMDIVAPPKVENPREATKTTNTTPRPTTTTAKPTTTANPKPTTTTTKPTTTTPTPSTAKPTATTKRTTTTTTTAKPATTTTVKPTTARPTTTTTAKSSTTTTTGKPAMPKQAPKATPAPRKPSLEVKPHVPPKVTIPIEEKIAVDSPPPTPEKLKVINKQGQHVEL